ncbi:MAG: putative carboxypeptidase [Thermoleophilia bacterium]|nr:putative carboxypeptidase [Thermoleophilia bacterium]
MITRAAHAPTTTMPKAAPAPIDYLDPEVVRERTEAGRVAEYETGELDPTIAERGAPSYFRTYEQVKAAMFELQAKYPALVEVRDIGDSSEKVAGTADRDVLMLRITAKGINDGKKATAFHIAGEHAREIANPELVLRHATQLLAGYGTDAEATGLLQTRVIDIVPMMNPDGHVVVEKGFTKAPGGNLMQRKNTSGPAGVDLNRNYDFHWNTGNGSSTNPRSDTYRGPSAASEPEVQAIQGQAAAAKPGIFVDWHSYSRLNLFPWGDTKDKAPQYAGLNALAKKFSTWNGYTPQQSIELYPTNGTSKDWMLGQHGIPGFTIETGDSFHQSDAQFEETWQKNAPVLTYVDKVADAPLTRVLGPDVSDVRVSAAGVTAAVSDAGNGGQRLAGAELVLDPFAAPGTGSKLTAADGSFDSITEQVTGAIAGATGAASAAAQLVYVRAQDDQGNWGPLTAQWLTTDKA